MANVVHRTTKQYRRSVNTPDFPVGTWIINPDLSAVAGVPNKYWKITGDVITEMDAGEKAAVDAADTAAALAGSRASAQAAADTLSEGIRAVIHLANKRDNFLLNRIVELQDALAAIKASSGAADNIRAAVPASFMASNTRPLADAITDYKDEITAGGAD